MRRLTRLCLLALATGILGATFGAGAASAATLTVDDGGPVVCPATYTSIQAAINDAVSGVDTVEVCAGTYPENLNLAKDITLNGAQDGVDARGRSADESIVTGADATSNRLALNTGVAGATVDGFTFTGGTRSIESHSGPINDLALQNNRVLGFTGNGIFLNDSGTDVTLDQNVVDGTSKVGGGALVHLDTDAFDGFHLTSNNIVNGSTGTGFFVDGNRNVGNSTARSPLIDDNLIDGNGTGANLGSRAFDGTAAQNATISDNTFSDSTFDGLQGGPLWTVITGNTFEDNGRNGLALTSFSNTDPVQLRGARNSTVEENEFTGNGFTMAGAGISFSATQAPGTISTNTANENNITGNATGARYLGTETIDVECNWWGATSGPTAVDNPGGTGDSVDGAGLDYRPWLTAPAPGGPCNGPLPIPQSKDDCKKGGWQTLTDDQGNPFKNQGDCVSYVSTGGRNKAAG